MSLEVIYGKIKNIIAVKELINALKNDNVSGVIYIGYPILASADAPVSIDALLISDSIGVVVFHIPPHPINIENPDEILDIQDTQDALYYAVENNLGRHSKLRKRRNLAVEVNVVTYLPHAPNFHCDRDEIFIAWKDSLGNILSNCKKTDPKYIPDLNAAIQRVTTIKPSKKRIKVKKRDSKGAALQKIEKEIANLDKWQKQAAIETPDGPQRIRGLAGSGKTVVIALKAAYLHSQHPDWTIAVTFHTRSLYQQFKDLIRRFTYEHSNDEPDWTKIKILHSWGSRYQPGLYSEIAAFINHPIRDFLYGKSKYGWNRAFEGVCNEVVQFVNSKECPVLYDAILVDEAQDLPIPFFRMIYKFLSKEKRVIWTYDELQNLTDYTVPPTEVLFGEDQNGNPIVKLSNPEDSAHQDIILPVCYRNTHWALTLAHSLGFGIYRKESLVQLFDDDHLWSEIGYEIIDGSFQAETNIVLRRKPNSYPQYFENLISSEDAVSCYCFKDFEEEINWIADQISKNVQDDELDYDDILIILPNAYTAKSRGNQLIHTLWKRNIPSHLAGVSSSTDEIFVPESVAISNIYRAKGNEAPMVYVANSDYCANGVELIRTRNSIFTAITRSRAWVRLTGSGKNMKNIIQEFNDLVKNGFSFNFVLPSDEERKRLRSIHRDRTATEKAKIKRVESGLNELIELFEKDEIDISNLPIHIKEGLERIIGK